MILLSILIPAIPSRAERAISLYNKIEKMAKGKDVEILMLMDNKMRSVGEKRNALKNAANGRFFMFVDDDDDLLELDELYKAIQENPDVDVITFKQRCYNSNGTSYIVTFGINNPLETITRKEGEYGDCRRPPFHVCAWNRRFKHISFGDTNYGEDWIFAESANNLATTSAHVDKVILSYNFNPHISEAFPKKKRAIVCLVSNMPRYLHGRDRLRESLLSPGILPPDIETFFFTGEESVGAPPHSENPYAFKIYAIEKVRALGFEQILWLDSSVVAAKNIDPVFQWLSQRGIFMEEAGHYVSRWCNDFTLNYFGLKREETESMGMFSAGFTGLDFTHPISVNFFEQWRRSMEAGCFKGEWNNHRHDMTAGSIIANLNGWDKLYSPGGHLFAYVGGDYTPPKETVVFHLKGL